MAGERRAIPPYRRKAIRSAGHPVWRMVGGVAVYFLVLWLAVLPRYPLPTAFKAGLGFLLAGLAAGLVARRPGWLAGLLAFLLLAVLVGITVGITLGVSAIGPAFLINQDTAGGQVETVQRAGQSLAAALVGLTILGGALSVIGGALGGRLRAGRAPRRTDGHGRPAE